MPELSVKFLEIASYGQSGSPGVDDSTLMELPAYLRMDARGDLWTLDTGRKSAIRLSRGTRPAEIVGRTGHGPGEIAVALGIDISPSGVVWVADMGNAKIVGFRDGRVVSEFTVDHAPAGVATPSDSTIWVGGDLMNTILMEYDRSGRRVGSAGQPILRGAHSFRLNQGVLAHGSGSCAVAWAYTFHSVVECFSAAGKSLWRVRGPVPVEPGADADPRRMSGKDVFAYTDVVIDASRIYALFVGHRATREGLHTRSVHVFDEATGHFLGAWQLPRQARFILRRDSTFALLADEPGPVVHVYRVREGEDR